jgi:hypothetical protein
MEKRLILRSWHLAQVLMPWPHRLSFIMSPARDVERFVIIIIESLEAGALFRSGAHFFESTNGELIQESR